MVIHVVQQGETIVSIADYYGIPVTRLRTDNGLRDNQNLVIGQSIIIAVPEVVYTVKEGDTLTDIAEAFQVSVMQLLRNNPFLSDRVYIYPGEEIVISYPLRGSITIHGNTNPNIDPAILRKTLPYLTYLSILNYTATKEGDIITYFDDSQVVEITKGYGVMPLLLLTTLTIRGEANIGIEYDLLLNSKYQNHYIDNLLDIIKLKGYQGVNISFQYINVTNIYLYNAFFTLISDRLNSEGFYVFVTINPNFSNVTGDVGFERVDYSIINEYAQNIIFMSYQWATNINPPSPISSIYKMDVFLSYVNTFISPDKIIIGIPTIGYKWELPFLPGFSSINAISFEGAVEHADVHGAVIQFDEISQTPYYIYYENKIQYIVWFIDSRSINALLELVVKYGLYGSGIWNITLYNPQLWLVINSQYDIVKVI
jgi:spore germination protein